MKIEKNDDLIARSWLLQEIEHDLGCFEKGLLKERKVQAYLEEQKGVNADV